MRCGGKGAAPASAALPAANPPNNNTNLAAVTQGGDASPELEVEEKEQYLSALPFLPPLTDKTLNTYYTVYGFFFLGVIVFGALLAPLLELRMGVGGEWARAGHVYVGTGSEQCHTLACCQTFGRPGRGWGAG